MMKHLVFFLLALFIISPLQLLLAEAPPSDKEMGAGIKGVIKDGETNRGLEYATVMVFHAADSTLAGGVITGPAGSFEVNLKPGKYYAIIDFLAYHSVTLSDIEVSRGRSTYDIGELLLSPDTGMLDEVEVIAERSQVEMSLDKRVFNVGRDISSVATNAIDVLENIPSVTVDVEGNVSLRGDDGVRILIDGKMSGLVGLSSRDALRSLQADMIERIEIVTNPSVRYDAEGTAGIINIVLKKDRRPGFNGSFDVSTGFPFQAGLGASANYRLRKVNFFANYSTNYRESSGKGTLYREFRRSDEDIRISTQDSKRERYTYSNTFRTGVEYFINPKNNLTISALYRHSDNNSRGTVTYDDFDRPNLLSNTTKRVEKEQSQRPNMEYNLLYRKQFDKEDQLFTLSATYLNRSRDQMSNITEMVLFDDDGFYPDDLLQRTQNDELRTNLEFQADYYHPFAGDAKLEAGIKASIGEIDNDYAVEQFLPGGDWENMEQFTNHFIYNENIYAAYLLFGDERERFSYLLGLRSEYSDIRTRLLNTNKDNHNTYIDYFPSAHFTYKLTNVDNIQISYSRRIRRPGFWQLNPFRSFADDRNVRTGNQFLQPVYTDSYELGYLRFWDRASFNGSIYYRNSENVFQRIERIDDSTGVITIRPENFASNESIGLELIGSGRIQKWWNINGSLNFFHSTTEGSIEEREYLTESFSWSGRISNRFTITRGFDMQLSSRFRGPREMPQGTREASWSIDAGLGKEVLNGNGTITLNVRDVFGTRKWAFETQLDHVYTQSEFQWRPTTITLNFNYRINQNQRRQQQRQGMSQDNDMDESMMEF